MSDTAVTIFFPDWLETAFKEAAAKHGHTFNGIILLTAYEYVERHTQEKRDLQNALQEDTPSPVRVANEILEIAVSDGASSIRLIPHQDQCSVIFVIGGTELPLLELPERGKLQIYDRYVTMASRGSVVRGYPGTGSFDFTSHDKVYRVILTWNGDYQSEMVLQIHPVEED